MAKTLVGLRLEPNVHKKLKVLAAVLGIPMGDAVARLLAMMDDKGRVIVGKTEQPVE